MTQALYDLPAPYAGIAASLFIIAVAYLMCVDWTHPNHPEKR